MFSESRQSRRRLSHSHPALIGLLLVLGAAHSLQANAEEPRRVSVTGEAERRVAPDMATLRVEVVIDNIDASTARQEADQLTGKALAVVSSQGIDASDVNATGLSVAPQYRWAKDSQQQKLTGYRVTRSIEIRLLELDRLGELLEGLSDTGVNRIQPPSLGLRDEESVYQSVLEAAAQNARSRAGVIAGALGAQLGDVLSAATQRQMRPQPMYAERAMMAADSAPKAAGASYQSGDISYNVQIEVTFELQ